MTAFNLEDAYNLIKQHVFYDCDMPPVKSVLKNFDVNTLDEGHVRPNMGVVSVRGIWFPRGYEWTQRPN